MINTVFRGFRFSSNDFEYNRREISWDLKYEKISIILLKMYCIDDAQLTKGALF